MVLEGVLLASVRDDIFVFTRLKCGVWNPQNGVKHLLANPHEMKSPFLR